GVGQVKAQLGPQRPLDHGLLELLENGLDPGRIHRARDQLLKKFRGQIDGPRDHRRLLLAWHTCSLVASWYASHTKFLTPSLPARDVRPYVRRNKTDRADAAGLVEAARCEQIADVPVKSPRQQGMQALHRVREQLKAQRTAAINLVRGVLREYGVTIPNGSARVRTAVQAALEDASDAVPMALRATLAEQLERIVALQVDMGTIEKRLAEEAANDVAVQRYLTVPGVGLLTATALRASAGELARFN